MKTLAATTEKASIKNRILVVDDDEQIRDILQMRLEADGYDVDCLGTIPEALKCVGRHEYSLVLLDIRVGAGNGVESLPLFRQQNADVPIFIITAHGDVDSAVRAFSRGANGYIRKPFQEGELKHQIAAAVESYRTKLEAKRLRGRSTADQAETLDKIIISRDPAMKPVLKQIQMAAGNNSNLVVQGASGTGKELVARALHTLSARKQGPFIAINCSAIPDNLLESELFIRQRRLHRCPDGQGGSYHQRQWRYLFSMKSATLPVHSSGCPHPTGEGGHPTGFQHSHKVMCDSRGHPPRPSPQPKESGRPVLLAPGDFLHIPPLKDRPRTSCISLKSSLRKSALSTVEL